MTDRELAECALLPCPFCGAHQPKVSLNIGGSPIRHQIKCDECPCRNEYHSSYAEQAIAAWNRRTPSSGGDAQWRAYVDSFVGDAALRELRRRFDAEIAAAAGAPPD